MFLYFPEFFWFFYSRKEKDCEEKFDNSVEFQVFQVGCRDFEVNHRSFEMETWDSCWHRGLDSIWVFIHVSFFIRVIFVCNLTASYSTNKFWKVSRRISIKWYPSAEYFEYANLIDRCPHENISSMRILSTAVRMRKFPNLSPSMSILTESVSRKWWGASRCNL